VKITKD